MRIKTLILVAALPISLSACGQSETDVATDFNNAGADDGALGNERMSVASSSAQAFVNTAAASDRFEIETSKLAAASANSAAIKDFAAMMVTAHTDSTNKLKSTVASDPSGIVVNDALNAEQQATIDGLTRKKGPEFDTAYAAAQISGHEKTLAELKDYAAAGDNAALKALAQDLIPVVTEHLNSAKALK